MNRLQLKLLLCVSMLVDHAALCFLEPATLPYILCRAFGRIAMPIVCFLLVEGFFHTRNKMKYGLRLGIFAVISEIPWIMLVARQRVLLADYIKSQGVEKFSELSVEAQSVQIDRVLMVFNVLFTLLACMMMLWVVDGIRERHEKKILGRVDLPQATAFDKVGMILLQVSVVFVTIFITYFLQMDYWIMGPMYVLAFYFTRRDRGAQLLVGAVIAVMYGVGIPSIIGGLLGVFALKFYNGKTGCDMAKYARIKYGFYLFYPLHLTVLVLVRYVIM